MTQLQSDWLILFEEHGNIVSSPNITSEDWRAVYDALQNPNARLGTFSTQEQMYVMKMQQILQILEVLTVH